MEATEAIAFCPQWSIDPNECAGKNTGFDSWFNPSMAGMAIRKADIAGRTCIMYDPSHPADSFHHDQIAAHCDDLVSVTVYGVGHDVTTLLAGSANLSEIIDKFRANEIDALKDIVRSIRRQHRLRKRLLLQKAADRHPSVCVKVLNDPQLVAELGHHDISALYSKLFCNFIAQNKPKEAENIVARLSPFICQYRVSFLQEAVADAELQLKNKAVKRWVELCNILKRLVTPIQSLLYRAPKSAHFEIKGYIMTHHNTILVYSTFNGNLIHKAPEILQTGSTERMDLQPLMLILYSGVEIVALYYKGLFLACCIGQNNKVEFKKLPCAEEGNHFIVSGGSINGEFALLLKQRYLSALIFGNVAYDKTQMLGWETFKLRRNLVPG
ncbi:MAG: hypothetical protein PHU14_15195 [Methylovulum sp.]|nr:hypothetical protein [Methylovulum sp.]